MKPHDLEQFTKMIRKKIFNLEKRQRWLIRDLEMYKKMFEVVYRDRPQSHEKSEQLEMFVG